MTTTASEYSAQIRVLSGRIHISVSDILSVIDYDDDNLVMIGGSLMDGFGSSTSDLDIYVISEFPQSIESFPTARHHRFVEENGAIRSTTDYMECSGTIIDTQYLTFDEVRELQRYYKKEFGRAQKRTKVLIDHSPQPKQKAHYRLYNALPVVNAGEYPRLMSSALTKEQLCYLLYRNAAGHYPLFNDVVGAWRDGDYLMGCEAAKTFLALTARALTHMHGNVNTDRKWTLRAVDNLPAAYENLTADYKEIFSRGCRDNGEGDQLIIDCLELADRFYGAIRSRLDVTPEFLTIAASEAITRLEIDAYTKWHRDITKEFVIRCRVYREDLPPLVDFLAQNESPAFTKFIDACDLQPRHLQ